MAELSEGGSVQERLSNLYAKLGHLRARLGAMSDDEGGRKEIYQSEIKSVSQKIQELKSSK